MRDIKVSVTPRKSYRFFSVVRFEARRGVQKIFLSDGGRKVANTT